ncbi:MAG: hypothetical protein GY768_15015 [Planctomycetaceae bacterium]|nr:hypothetical protein [Planctomycetaceae bacterium]
MTSNPCEIPPNRSSEAALFRQLRSQLFLATFRQFLQGSRLRILLLAALTLTFWIGMFVLFHEGFSLLVSAVGHEATLARTVHAVYNVFFLSLLFMVGVSSGILYYGSVYKSEEVALLLTTPARTSRIAIYKYQESMLLACWGFILLGSPLLVAYGVVNHAPWNYYVLLPPFLLSFSAIAAGMGVIGCTVLIYFAPRLRLHSLAILITILIAMMIYFVWGAFSTRNDDMLSVLWLEQMLNKFQLAEQRVLPSWWLSTGLLEAAHSTPKGVIDSIGLLCVLVSNGLLITLVIGVLADKLLRKGFGSLSGGQRRSVGIQLKWLDRLIQRILNPLPVPMQLILLKDLRLFRRDPLQWTQFLLFFGLLCLYFFYVRRFNYGTALTGWMTMIGFMNLAVVGLILSTFTTRFVFPMISMEGFRFWILGTLPINRSTILWSKFLFASVVCCLPCSVLILLSDLALQLWTRTPLSVILHQVLCLCMGFGLAGLSVGLGAYLPNLQESSPAKIAAGFGGTLTLVLSAILIVTVVMPPAIATYFWVTAEHVRWHTMGLLTTMTSSIAVSVLCTVIPMRLGFRAFRQMEMC